MYVQSTYIWGFWEDHRLRKLWSEGKLEFVLWDSTAECVGHLKCMQVTCEIPFGISCVRSQWLRQECMRHIFNVLLLMTMLYK